MFDSKNTFKAQAIFGVSNRAELGAALSTGYSDGLNVSGKYRFTDAHANFNLAAGAAVTLANHNQTGVDVYLVGTEGITLTNEERKLLLSFGVHFISFESDNTMRPFIGAQLPLGSHTEVGAEYQIADGDLFKAPLTSVELRHRFSRIWAAQVGYSNATGFGSTHSYRPFIGAQYTFTQAK